MPAHPAIKDWDFTDQFQIDEEAFCESTRHQPALEGFQKPSNTMVGKFEKAGIIL
jgi:hypothetical protein